MNSLWNLLVYLNNVFILWIWAYRVQISLGILLYARTSMYAIKYPDMKLENWNAATCKTLAQVSTPLVYIKQHAVIQVIQVSSFIVAALKRCAYRHALNEWFCLWMYCVFIVMCNNTLKCYIHREWESNAGCSKVPWVVTKWATYINRLVWTMSARHIVSIWVKVNTISCSNLPISVVRACLPHR